MSKNTIKPLLSARGTNLKSNRLFNLLYLIIIFSLLSSNIFSQTIDERKSSKTLSRLKLSGGYFLGEKSVISGNSWFVNFNYRATLINKNDRGIEITPAVEGGINIANRYFPLYIKAGPEVKIFKNVIVGATFG